MIHINQKTFLWDKYKDHFQMDYDNFSEKVKDITEEKYRQLLALYYNHQINEMRQQMLLLGVKLN